MQKLLYTQVTAIVLSPIIALVSVYCRFNLLPSRHLVLFAFVRSTKQLHTITGVSNGNDNFETLRDG